MNKQEKILEVLENRIVVDIDSSGFKRYMLECEPKELAQELSKLDDWVKVSVESPSVENGHIDRTVNVLVKNKNKEDGIYLPDCSSFDGSSWSKRINTWETIVAWKPISLPKD
jgi:hypothetical protein